MKSLSRLGVAGAVSIAIVLSNGALAQECEPSRWGPDDEIGAANYVTPERVLAATKLVNEGQSHPLGIVVDPKMPVFPPRSTSMQIVQPGQHNGRDLSQDFGWPLELLDLMDLTLLENFLVVAKIEKHCEAHFVSVLCFTQFTSVDVDRLQGAARRLFKNGLKSYRHIFPR